MDSGTVTENWNRVHAHITSWDSVDASQVNAFFSRLEPQVMSEGFLMLTADNDFIKSWVEQHYLSLIQRALNELYQMPFTVVVEVNPSAAGSEGPASMQAAAPSATNVASAAAPAPIAEPQPQSASEPLPAAPMSAAAVDQSSPRTESPFPAGEALGHGGMEEGPASSLTFENFVIGESNKMAYSLAVEVAETPGGSFLNPLFIYGKSGLGKTHLMRAVQNYICETQPYLRTIYVDSAELVDDYTDAVASHDKEKESYKNFKNHYEEADVLLIDDIQFLQGKKETLDIVFQIFNKLITQGRQIILSADRAPKNIDIDERYHSRFNDGATIDIQPPEIETKLGIVKSFIGEYRRKGDLGDFSIPEDIQMYIAENSSSNIRELKSAITKVIYQLKFFNQKELSIDDVRALLKDHFTGGATKNLKVEDIQRVVEEFFKVKHSDLVGSNRSRNIVYPRQIAIYLCRQLLDLPYNDIGKKFNRDHSTAMHSVTSVEEQIQKNREVQEEIEILKQLIKEC